MTTEQFLPVAKNCFICNKPLSEIGGRRLVAWNGHHEIKQTLQKTQEANEDKGLTLREWICQKCGKRACMTCGEPLRRPAGCDILLDSGEVVHTAIFPFDSGCINSECENHRDFPVA